MPASAGWVRGIASDIREYLTCEGSDHMPLGRAADMPRAELEHSGGRQDVLRDRAEDQLGQAPEAYVARRPDPQAVPTFGVNVAPSAPSHTR